MNIAAVILAAGLSSRMGALKPLLHLGEKSLLGHCRDLFAAAGLSEIIVVAGHRCGEIAAEAESLGLRWVENKDYRLGMLSSIQCAVTVLPKDTNGFFVLPVDIPLVRPATLRTLLAAFPESCTSVAYPEFAGRRGHPPLIPAGLGPAILGYDGGGGLEGLLGRYQGLNVAVWDEGILVDADTRADLHCLQQRAARLSVPTRQEAEVLAGLLLSERGLAHGLLVGRVADALGQALNDRGYRLDMDLLYAAALLHDIAKGQPCHEIRGAEMLLALGLGEVAALVAAHKDFRGPASGEVAEKEIVCLADKLVSGSRRVQIEERYGEKLAVFAAEADICRNILDRRNRAQAMKAHVEQAAAMSLETILNRAGL